MRQDEKDENKQGIIEDSMHDFAIIVFNSFIEELKKQNETNGAGEGSVVSNSDQKENGRRTLKE